MIDINKKYRTRDGREVRIYATDGRGGTAIHGAIKTPSGYWQQESWWSNGQLLTTLQSDSDLIEVPPRHKRTVWLNMYEDGDTGKGFSSKESAESVAKMRGRIGCIKVELDFEEGEGL
jgi:hypothetical protein